MVVVRSVLMDAGRPGSSSLRSCGEWCVGVCESGVGARCVACCWGVWHVFEDDGDDGHVPLPAYTATTSSKALVCKNTTWSNTFTGGRFELYICTYTVI